MSSITKNNTILISIVILFVASSYLIKLSELIFDNHKNETGQPVNYNIIESKEDLRARLAAEAKRTGIMQAAPGTEQGKTGWYIDSDGQLTSWLVSESGEWTRMS